MFGKKRGKKGIELSVNTIVILVIVVIALVLIIIFFAGTSTGIFGQIRGILGGNTAGYDKTLAIENCDSFCEQLQTIGERANDPDVLSSTPFCTRHFDIDTNADDKADTRYYCNKVPGSVQVENFPDLVRPASVNNGKGSESSPSTLGVSCTVATTRIDCP